MSLKIAGELSAVTMTNDAKFEEELTSQFKTDMRNLTNLTPALKISKVSTLMGFFLTKYIMQKKYKGDLFDGTEYRCNM